MKIDGLYIFLEDNVFNNEKNYYPMQYIVDNTLLPQDVLIFNDSEPEIFNVYKDSALKIKDLAIWAGDAGIGFSGGHTHSCAAELYMKTTSREDGGIFEALERNIGIVLSGLKPGKTLKDFYKAFESDQFEEDKTHNAESTTFIRFCLDYFNRLLSPGHDLLNFSIFVKEEAEVIKLEKTVAALNAKVMEMDWYKENKDNLYWCQWGFFRVKGKGDGKIGK